MAPSDRASPLVPRLVAKAITGMRAELPNIAVATKLLHLKRPNLVPILDSIVLEQLGWTSEPVAELILHLRDQGRANVETLKTIQARLVQDEPGRITVARPLVRIFEALLWATHPRSSIPLPEGEWVRTFGRAHGG